MTRVWTPVVLFMFAPRSHGMRRAMANGHVRRCRVAKQRRAIGMTIHALSERGGRPAEGRPFNVIDGGHERSMRLRMFRSPPSARF
jgi:hypothetical protein